MKNEAEARVRLTRWELAVLIDGMDTYERQIKFSDGKENSNVGNVGKYLRDEYNTLRGKLVRARGKRTF